MAARSCEPGLTCSFAEELRLSDFTYVSTWSGFVCVAFEIDAYARHIVGSRVSRTAHASFVLDALEQALHERSPVRRGGLVHHCDRTPNTSAPYSERLAEGGFEPSVGRMDGSFDDALAEANNCLPKAEVIHRLGRWRSFYAFEFAMLTWVDSFPHRGLLEPIGNVPTAGAEERCWAMLDKQQMVAGLKANALRTNPSDLILLLALLLSSHLDKVINETIFHI